MGSEPNYTVITGTRYAVPPGSWCYGLSRTYVQQFSAAAGSDLCVPSAGCYHSGEHDIFKTERRNLDANAKHVANAE